MKKLLILLAATLLLAGFAGLASAEEGSWTGYISDEACAKDYAKASKAEHVGCAKGCVSRGGAWALAMEDGHVVLDIDKELAEKNLGMKVIVKGTLDQETNTVKVSSIEMDH